MNISPYSFRNAAIGAAILTLASVVAGNAQPPTPVLPMPAAQMAPRSIWMGNCISGMIGSGVDKKHAVDWCSVAYEQAVHGQQPVIVVPDKTGAQHL